MVAGAERARPTRVPPNGIPIAKSDRSELQSGVDAFGREIASLQRALADEPDLLALLPDVQIFHRAVDWPLRYDEFYRSNEVSLARKLLEQGTERARQLREGRAPWLTATGLVVRGFVSRIDGSVQPYGLVVPSGFAADHDKSRRLDVWLHGRDNNLTELKFISDRQRSYGEFTPADTIVLHPYGRYCNAFKFAGETDVFEAMEHVKKFYRIDEKRMALRGFSMGGAGVWHLAAHHPGVWAVAAPGAGFAETAEYQKLGTNRAKVPPWEQELWQLYDATDYAANFFNLPVIAYNGTDDPQRQAADVMERAMKAEGLTLPRVWGTNVGHKYTPEGKREVNRFVDESVAKGMSELPPEIHFTTRTLRYHRAPGISVTRLSRHWERADVTMKIGSNKSFNIQTRNVEQLQLAFSARTIDPRKVAVDGKAVFIAGENLDGTFSPLLEKQRDGWTQVIGDMGTGSKRPGIQGPIDDAFMDSFLVVRPTGTALNEKTGAWVSSALTRATNDWRAQFRGDARVKEDSQVTEADIATHNLILFGDPQSNLLLARITKKLPVTWRGEFLQVGNKMFSLATHVPMLIFPNPLNPRRYIVLNTGFTFAEAGKGSNAQQTPKLPDYAVLDVATDSVVLADFFDEQWELR